MDHARKIGKPEKPTIWRKCPSPPCSITDKPLIKDEEVTEDKCLTNWRKWLNDRKKHYKYYSKWTDRDHQDLLINTPENFRRKVEMKELVKITVGSVNKKKTDKYRGNPEFWVVPEFLPKHGNPDLPDISINLVKKQSNATSEIERIILPELILEEKGLLCQNKTTSLWNSSKNTKTLRDKLSQEIKSIEAKELGIKKLAVKGTRLGQRKSESTKVPIVTITEAESFEYQNEHNIHEEDVIALKIQDREIKFVECKSLNRSNTKSLDDFTWSLIFKSSGCNIIEHTIRLENRGTFTITYRWRYGSIGSTFTPQTPRSSPFFFNKNKNLILPGQITILQVWFRSWISCSATEFWTLVTDPKLCHAPLVFRFWGCCSPFTKTSGVNDTDIGIDSNFIDRYLDRRIRDTKIQEIIEEILGNVQKKRLPSPSYGSLFVESEIFQAKNPFYFYHPTVIRQLRDIYANATSHDSPPWSLSLDDLRGVLVQLRKSELRNEALLRFSELCRQCLEPSLYTPIENTKRSMVYNMLCSFVNKFEAEKEYVRTECSHSSNEITMKSEVQGDTFSSTNASKISQGSLTSRRKTKRVGRLSSRPRISSKTSIITTNHEGVLQTSEKEPKRECLLYKEIFYIRIRTLLMDTINAICGIIDTVNNIKDPE